jgi:hypothetical protein
VAEPSNSVQSAMWVTSRCARCLRPTELCTRASSVCGRSNLILITGGGVVPDSRFPRRTHSLHHVSHILHKLGRASRAAVASWYTNRVTDPNG